MKKIVPECVSAAPSTQGHPSESDLRFGQLVVSHGFVTSEQVRECLRLRYEYVTQRIRPIPRLGDLLVSHGYLTAEQCERARRETAAVPAKQGDPPKGAAGMPDAVAEALLTARNLMGKYVRVTLLGEGGMGEVWRAWDRDLSRWVALKILKPGSLDELGQFQREARTVAKLVHPNVAAVYDVGEHLGRPYIAMQIIDGCPLHTIPRDDPKLLVRLLRDACLGVHCAHEHGIIHRDLKPENIIVEERSGIATQPGGVGLKSYVVDFGLAKDVASASALSVQGAVMGTPAYMSPEQARGRGDLLGVRSDVYSLGATLFDVLTGRPPFESPDPYALMRLVVETDAPGIRSLNPAIDRDLEAVIAKCLEKSPLRRYASASELARDLDRYLGGEPVTARPLGVVYRLRKRIRRHPFLSAALLGAVLATAAVAALFISGNARYRREIVAGESDHTRALKAADLCRRALESIKEAKTLWRIRSSRREQWEQLLEEADSLADQALWTYPDLPACHQTRGELLEARGRWREAALSFRQALRHDPSSAGSWYSVGVCNVELFNAVMMQPGFIEVGLPEDEILALRERQAEPFKKCAQEAFHRYSQLRGDRETNSVSTRCAEAAFALAEGRMEEAERACDELLQATQTDERVWLLKAKVSCFRGDYVCARETLDTLIGEVMPHLAEAYYLRGWVRQKTKDLQGAIADCSRALDLNPSLPASYVTRAWAKAGLNDDAGAEVDAAAAIASDATCAPAYYARGWVRETRGDLTGAVEDYGSLVALYPTNAAAYKIRGWAFERKGDPDHALEDYKKSLSLGHGESRDYANCARMRLRLGELDGAVRDYTEAIRLGTSGRLLAERGQAYLAQKEYSQALRDFRAAEVEDESLGPELAPLIRECEGVIPPC
jgi:tetratricopeptide (TPR) repeat protein